MTLLRQQYIKIRNLLGPRRDFVHRSNNIKTSLIIGASLVYEPFEPSAIVLSRYVDNF